MGLGNLYFPSSTALHAFFWIVLTHLVESTYSVQTLVPGPLDPPFLLHLSANDIFFSITHPFNPTLIQSPVGLAVTPTHSFPKKYSLTLPLFQPLLFAFPGYSFNHFHKNFFFFDLIGNLNSDFSFL